MAGTFIVNREPGRCTMVSLVRVTSVDACQTTYRSTKPESLAGETRPAGLFLHYRCSIHEIVRQSFGVTEKTCDVVDNDDAHAPRHEQLFLQMVAGMCPTKKQNTKR